MTELTSEAKEQFSLGLRIRLRIASWVLSLAYALMPKEYYDDVEQDELRRIAEVKGYGLQEVGDDGQ